MFTLNTLQLYRGGRSLRATEHSPLNATNGGAMDALLCNYMNSVCKVTSYCLGMAELKSPVFKEQKEWLEDYQQALTSLKAEANIWKDSILEYLVTAPETIVNYNEAFSLNHKEILRLLNVLVTADSEKTRKELSDKIKVLLDHISVQEGLVNSIETRLKDFQAKVMKGRKELEKLMDFLTKDDEDLKLRVKELSDEIARLQAECDSKSNWLTASEVSLGISLTIGGVALSLLMAPDPFSKIPLVITIIACGVVGGVGTIGSIAGIIMECEENKRLVKSINQQTLELNKKNYDLSVLATAMAGVKALEDACNEAGYAMINIGLVWKALHGDLSKLHLTIEECDNPKSNEMIHEAINELGSARTQWEEMVENARIMASIRPVIADNLNINL